MDSLKNKTSRTCSTTRAVKANRWANTSIKGQKSPCSFRGCDRTAIAKKLCDTHYRQKQTGKRLKTIQKHGGREYQPVEPRFFPKISKKLVHPKRGECWLWIGGLQSNKRYGQFYMFGKNYQAHRASYIHFIGPIPKGEHVHHKCGQTKCVNPEHLEVSTQRENTAEMFARRAYVETIDAANRRIANLERRVKNLNTTVERQHRQLKKIRGNLV